MAYEPRNNEGTLFRDKNRKSDKHPEFTGSAMVNGQEFWLSAWVNESKKDGSKYFKLTFKPKGENRPSSAAPADDRSYGEELDDSIPF